MIELLKNWIERFNDWIDYIGLKETTHVHNTCVLKQKINKSKQNKQNIWIEWNKNRRMWSLKQLKRVFGAIEIWLAGFNYEILNFRLKSNLQMKWMRKIKKWNE